MNREKTLEVSNAVVDSNPSSKGTHVSRSTCLGIRHLGEMRCE
jgi:hypothetical protein